MSELAPTAFHRTMRDALAAEEPGLFAWYSSDAYEAKRADRLRLELLRSSYRIGAEAHARAHTIARAAAAAVGVDVPIALYQMHHAVDGANAGLCFSRGEAHVILSGPILTTATDAELAALFGHELAHHKLWTLEGGAFLTTAELLEAAGTDPRGSPAFAASAMRNRRWTEIFADRGAAIAAGGIEPAIAMLLKLHTGLVEVSVTDYLAQAREVVARLAELHARSADADDPEAATQRERLLDDTHPEHAVRAVALARWQERGAEADVELAPMIEGNIDLELLDLVQQRTEVARTRALIDRVLAPPWMRTEANLVHARAYFTDYEWATPMPVGVTPLPEYASYVLLDFATVDRALGDIALAQALVTAREIGLRDTLGALAKKELKQTLGALTKLEERAPELFAKASVQGD